MKTGMKSFVLVSIILAFFIFNLTGCKGKKEEETQISQQAAQIMDDVEKVEPKPKEEVKREEEAEKAINKEEGTQEEKEAKLVQWSLEGVEEIEVPRLIWEKFMENDFINRSTCLVDNESKKKLIEENPSLSEILSEESSSPFFLLKGREKQYLTDIKGNIKKEIPYPPSDMRIVFDEKTKKVIGETRGGEVLWQREWEQHYEKAKISPDQGWAILCPTADAGYGFSEGEHIVAIDRYGKELWRLNFADRPGGMTGWPRFSTNGKRLVFGIRDTLYYASKEKILWKKTFHRRFLWYHLDISPSGNFIILPDYRLYLINNSGSILWEANDVGGLVNKKFGFFQNERFFLILGRNKIPSGSPFFIAVLDIQKGKLIKKTREWIESESPLRSGILKYVSFIKIYESKYLFICIPDRKDSEIYLYDISHILTLSN